MSYSARPTSTDLLTKLIHQTSHGFVWGDLIVFNGSAYVLAQANTLTGCQGVMMVSLLVDVDDFYATQVGYVTGIDGSLAPFTPGTLYYVSDSTAGHLTATAPTNPSSTVLPCFIADTTNSGYFFTGAGGTSGGTGGLSWTTITSDTTLAANTGYFVNSASELNLTLPAAIAAGSTIQIATINTGGFIVKQNAGQSVNLVQDTSTVGITGSVELDATSGVKSGSMELICATTNTTFKIIKSTGNYTFA